MKIRGSKDDDDRIYRHSRTPQHLHPSTSECSRKRNQIQLEKYGSTQKMKRKENVSVGRGCGTSR